jgi:hypothetical protein
MISLILHHLYYDEKGEKLEKSVFIYSHSRARPPRRIFPLPNILAEPFAQDFEGGGDGARVQATCTLATLASL